MCIVSNPKVLELNVIQMSIVSNPKLLELNVIQMSIVCNPKVLYLIQKLVTMSIWYNRGTNVLYLIQKF